MHMIDNYVRCSYVVLCMINQSTYICTLYFLKTHTKDYVYVIAVACQQYHFTTNKGNLTVIKNCQC